MRRRKFFAPLLGFKIGEGTIQYDPEKGILTDGRMLVTQVDRFKYSPTLNLLMSAKKRFLVSSMRHLEFDSKEIEYSRILGAKDYKEISPTGIMYSDMLNHGSPEDRELKAVFYDPKDAASMYLFNRKYINPVLGMVSKYEITDNGMMRLTDLSGAILGFVMAIKAHKPTIFDHPDFRAFDIAKKVSEAANAGSEE